MSNPHHKFVLVIEDDADLRDAIQGSLEKAGYRAIGAQSSREATGKLGNQQFACILLDIQLGNERGDELLDTVRNRKVGLNSDTPVVVISGFLDRDIVSSLAGKVQGALVKPFEMSALLEMVTQKAGPA